MSFDLLSSSHFTKLVLCCYLLIATQLHVPFGDWVRGLSQANALPFPCQDHQCGCDSREKCLTRCCCFKEASDQMQNSGLRYASVEIPKQKSCSSCKVSSGNQASKETFRDVDCFNGEDAFINSKLSLDSHILQPKVTWSMPSLHGIKKLKNLKVKSAQIDQRDKVPI